MPTSDESTPPFESHFPELRIPKDGWQSNIPEHLLTDADPQTTWLMNEISKNTQATEFSCRGVEKISDHLREMNGKVHKTVTKLSKTEEDIEGLKEQAKAISPFVKPVVYFFNLWEFRAFRWVFYGFTFFFFTYLLPWYLKNPWDLSHLFELLFGSK